MRSLFIEAFFGTSSAIRFPKNLAEFLWTLMLFAARFHLWVLVFFNVRLMNRPLTTLWKRVETTK